MERISFNGGVVLLVASLIFGLAFAEQHNDERNGDFSLSQQDSQLYNKRKPASLWFGPRLGRKKRYPLQEEILRTPPLDREQLAAVLGFIPESPWSHEVINDPKRFSEGKRYTVNFTPRLGRESGEELYNGQPQAFAAERLVQDSDMPGEMSQRSPPFAPRLGRRTFSYSPRLGRESDKLVA